MSQIDVVHESGRRHGALIRGHRVVFDQPYAAGGEDAGPTPTEMFVVSLAGCVAHYAERFLARHDVAAAGLRVHATFAMAEHPARVSSIEMTLTVPTGFPDGLRDALHAVVYHCTVHNSIRMEPRIHVGIEIPAKELVAARS